MTRLNKWTPNKLSEHVAKHTAVHMHAFNLIHENAMITAATSCHTGRTASCTQRHPLDDRVVQGGDAALALQGGGVALEWVIAVNGAGADQDHQTDQPDPDDRDDHHHLPHRHGQARFTAIITATTTSNNNNNNNTTLTRTTNSAPKRKAAGFRLPPA